MEITKSDLFATPVWEIDTGLGDNFINNLNREINEYTQTVTLNDKYTYNIWNSPGKTVGEFKKFCESTIEECTKDYFLTKDNVFLFVRGWLNYNTRGANIPIHGHGNTTVVMNFYINTPENCGDLLLIDPRGETGWDQQIDVVHGARFRRIKPKKGKLILFPGYLLHMVEDNLSNEPRISLASNVSVLFNKQSAASIMEFLKKNV